MINDRKTVLPIVLLAVLGSVPAPAQDLPPATEVLKRLEAAVGAPADRARVRSLRASGVVTMKGMPGEGVLEEVYLGAAAARTSVKYPGMEMTMGQRDALCWSTDPAMGVAVLEGADAGAPRRLFGVIRRAAWDTLYTGAKTIGREEIDGRACLKLEMDACGVIEHWFVDEKDTNLVRYDLALPDMMGGTLPVAISFSEWKQVGGVNFAHQRVMKLAAAALTYRWSTLEVNPELAKDSVAPSEKVRAAIADQAKRARSEPPKAGECALVVREEVHTASIRMKIKPSEVSRSLAVALPEVMKLVSRQRAQMAGPPFSRYHAISDDEIDLEAGIPVAAPIEPEGRVMASKLPGGRLATTWHFGPYHELASSHELLRKWLVAAGHGARGAHWEVYWTDPGLEPDPAKWKTEILWPVNEEPAR